MEAWDPPKIIIFSKKPFYRFLKDVHNKTLTFEVWRDPKIETENDKQAFKFQLRYKSEKSIQI